MELLRENTIVITCAPGLTEPLRLEVESLGYAVDRVRDTSIEIRGTFHETMRLNLYLRTAFNVLFLLKEFKCSSPDELYSRTSKLHWEEIISPGEYFCVTSKVDTPTIDNWMFPNLKVKDAIADRISKKCGKRPNSGSKRDNAVVTLHWKGDYCRLFINTSGQKLSDRGYRKIPHRAPMRESLAAAVILDTGYSGDVPLVNPMCGSGTLAIEAALIGMNRASGLLRDNFGFMHILDYDKRQWNRVHNQGVRECREKPSAPIIATDIDQKAVDAARKNAEAAGVGDLIEFSVCDFADTSVPDEAGIVVMNPEYGERLGDQKELVKTYKRIGDFLKEKCAGYKGYIFTGNLPLAKKIGLRTSRRTVFYNADIECRLLEYELYKGSRKRDK